MKIVKNKDPIKRNIKKGEKFSRETDVSTTICQSDSGWLCFMAYQVEWYEKLKNGTW